MRKLARVFVAIALVILFAPVVVGAQQPMPVIGYLGIGSPESDNIPGRLVAFRRGLEEGGYIEGQNLEIEYRWAEGKYDRLLALAADLVRRQVTLIVTQNNATTLAAKATTSTVPIIGTVGLDPVRSGLVASLNRPGGNVTGVAVQTAELMGKRLDLLGDEPHRDRVRNTNLQHATGLLGLRRRILQASTPNEIEAAFKARRAGALVVSGDTFFTSQRAQIVALAARPAIPAIYVWRRFVESGGLMSYGPDFGEGYHQLGLYTAKILKGARPADLPIQQMMKLELVVNLKTAKALGLTISQSLLLRADQVIQ